MKEEKPNDNNNNVNEDSENVNVDNSKKQQHKAQAILGKIYKKDHCMRFYPRSDQKSFRRQLEYTQMQILQYFPDEIKNFNQQFVTSGKYINAAFWVVDIAFISFCHKIKILSRLLGERTWKMFTFKGLMIALPMMFLNKVQLQAEKQHQDILFNASKNIFKKYKQTGDILQLNCQIQLEQFQTQFEKNMQLNSFPNLHGWKKQNSTVQYSVKNNDVAIFQQQFK